MNGLSLIIPTYNRAMLLKGALESIRGLVVPPGVDWEILVIDNNCTDDTARVVASFHSLLPIRRVVETRQGLCYSRNRASDEAVYEQLIYLDDDIRVASTWMVGYLDALEKWDADAVVGPVNAVLPQPLPAYATPTVLQLISSTYSLKGEVPILLERERAHEITGCNFGIRRAVLRELGGFDPSLDRVGAGLLSGGDWELGWRLAGAGKSVVYHPGCSIDHVIHAGKLERPYLLRRAFGDAVSRTAIAAKHGRPVSVARRLRMGARALRLWGRFTMSSMAGRAGEALEQRLQIQACIGTAAGPWLLKLDPIR